jgi:Zn finger protein HypA/HybF involved in hydrogenase expression
MHERSLIRALIRQVGQLVSVNGAQRVSRIVVRIGELSGVDAKLFMLADQMQTNSTQFSSIR